MHGDASIPSTHRRAALSPLRPSLFSALALAAALLGSEGCALPLSTDGGAPGSLVALDGLTTVHESIGDLPGSAIINLAARNNATGPRVLAVVAHPDDEIAFAGVLYKNATLLDGISDILTITDGAGGYKYSTLAERFYELPLTDPEVGARELPRIRQRELTHGCRILAVSRLHWLGQPDTGYTLNPADVLSEPAMGWDVEAIRDVLRDRIPEYDYILTHTPTAGTHGHHQAATRLAIAATKELSEPDRPIVLGVRFPGEDGSAPAPFGGAPDDPSTRQYGPRMIFDRGQKFGYRGRLDYSIIANLAIAAHASQGTMQLLVGPAREESYYVYAGATDREIRQAKAWFAELARQQYPVIEPPKEPGS